MADMRKSKTTKITAFLAFCFFLIAGCISEIPDSAQKAPIYGDSHIQSIISKNEALSAYSMSLEKSESTLFTGSDDSFEVKTRLYSDILLDLGLKRAYLDVDEKKYGPIRNTTAESKIHICDGHMLILDGGSWIKRQYDDSGLFELDWLGFVIDALKKGEISSVLEQHEKPFIIVKLPKRAVLLSSLEGELAERLIESGADLESMVTNHFLHIFFDKESHLVQGMRMEANISMDRYNNPFFEPDSPQLGVEKNIITNIIFNHAPLSDEDFRACQIES